MTVSSDVSVPCTQCRAPIGLATTACAACGAQVSKDLRRALEERLEASSALYRDAKSTVRSTGVGMLFVALVCFAIGALRYLLARGVGYAPDAEGDAEAVALLARHAITGGVALAAFFPIRAAPRAGLAGALCAWLVGHAAVALADPSKFAGESLSPLGVLLRLFELGVALVLGRGLLAAQRAHRIHTIRWQKASEKLAGVFD